MTGKLGIWYAIETNLIFSDFLSLTSNVCEKTSHCLGEEVLSVASVENIKGKGENAGYFLYMPRIDRSGAYSFGPVCPVFFARLSVWLFVCKNFYTGHIFWLVRLRAVIFHMSIPCDKTFLLVPSSRSSVRVNFKYQDHRLKKKWLLPGH